MIRSVTSRTRFPIALACLALVAAGCTGVVASQTREQGIQKIQHVIVIMQENRSFDSYFGTYPGRTASRCGMDGPTSACRTRGSTPA